MEVPLGSQTKVILPDGSVVCLNSGSVLKYDPAFLRKKSREVYLIGEGYFEVQKNPEKPFIVHVDDINVKVSWPMNRRHQWCYCWSVPGLYDL